MAVVKKMTTKVAAPSENESGKPVADYVRDAEAKRKRARMLAKPRQAAEPIGAVEDRMLILFDLAKLIGNAELGLINEMMH